ncbi:MULTISPECIES: DUF5680 domain-containing protein [Burkholderia cepacia complex]|uniref:DUF5680 domain-containing protein n=2 Tax=Burkholderia cepacia complex TaxID=87882 RepID=A0AAW3MH70_9BURK|nr:MULTISPECIES: DUF5680 domain-containing protein [Burkholderia cepacia complex]AYZ66264.1 hypothetical protein EGY31_23975 [Burkholderia multivorans]AOI71446.1 hypothetical protein WI31_18965 [Burkholderia ubonensis]AOK17715.1 hypothetical protein WT26_17995 [Burkholderia cepacia]AOK24451.1 hypothetical protein WK67_17915 [Burkholderia ubonensis]KUZ23510.1 hypothetical protein WI29_11305 [Burkholderia ubonensis]
MIDELSMRALCSFLVEAKRHTFAADARRMPSKSPASKNYQFECGSFRYEDQYFGEIVDVGMETVWYDEVPVWGMTYRGGVYQEYVDIKHELFAFLREALRNPPLAFPTRGPENHQRGALTYANHTEGDISAFHGRETVQMDGVFVCYRRYVGGLIFGKRNPGMRLLHDLDAAQP